MPEATEGKAARILYLDYTNQIGLGGGQRSLALLMRHLDRRRFAPVLACPPRERLLELVDRSIPVIPLPIGERFGALSRFRSSWRRLATASVSSWPAIRRLRRHLAEWRVDVIHANNLKMLWLASIASAGRIPVIWHVRDIFPSTLHHKVLCRLAVRGASRVVAVSQAVAAQFPDIANIAVLYNAVEMPAAGLGLARRRFRARYSIPDRAVVAGYAGRLDPGKGLAGLVKAFAQVSGRPELRLLIVGEGPERAGLERLAAQQGRAGRVHLIPYQADMDAVWSAMDIAVLPSTQPDSFPRSVIEAMSHGKPVVGSRSGGIAEAIEDGVTGFVCTPGDTQALAGLLECLAGQPELAARMGAAGRVRCEQLFSAETQARKLSEMYTSLIDRRFRRAA